jgi:transposase
MNPRIYKRKDEFRFELEDFTNRRDIYVDMMKEEKLRWEKNPEQKISESICKHIEYLKNEIKTIEEELEKVIEANAKEEAEVLVSEKGIGDQTAAILIGSLPELGVLDNRKITKLVGLAPMTRESGKMSSERHIRGGRSRVRRALFMASISAIRSNPKVKDFYKRLRSEGKNVFVALTAVAHKLLIILNSKMKLFREGEKYF